MLDGFNGLRGGVKIDHFDLPGNDPAGGITLALATTITNPSSVGIALSSIGFQNSFGSTNIGPAASTEPFALVPKTTISLPLAGRLVPQVGQGLDDVSQIFNAFIHGIPTDLVVYGDSAGPTDCTWLNNGSHFFYAMIRLCSVIDFYHFQGIKKLAIAVVLPAAQLSVINSITLNQLTLKFTETTAYSPAFTTDNTLAKFQLPFALPVSFTRVCI